MSCFGSITAALPATAIPASNERREPRNPVIFSMVSLYLWIGALRKFRFSVE
jgi:hypothetical protein